MIQDISAQSRFRDLWKVYPEIEMLQVGALLQEGPCASRNQRRGWKETVPFWTIKYKAEWSRERRLTLIAGDRVGSVYWVERSNGLALPSNPGVNAAARQEDKIRQGSCNWPHECSINLKFLYAEVTLGLFNNKLQSWGLRGEASFLF